MKGFNLKELEEWVINDEGLYRNWKQSGKTLSNYVKEHRRDLRAMIQKYLDKEPSK